MKRLKFYFMFIIIAMVDINFIQAQTEGDKNIEIIKEFYFKIMKYGNNGSN